jgi:hypothetical protein
MEGLWIKGCLSSAVPNVHQFSLKIIKKYPLKAVKTPFKNKVVIEPSFGL